tara:strand:+ start:132 stop:413 length:282 start_codon:yes stop_codon:yes gene_type:complete
MKVVICEKSKQDKSVQQGYCKIGKFYILAMDTKNGKIIKRNPGVHYCLAEPSARAGYEGKSNLIDLRDGYSWKPNDKSKLVEVNVQLEICLPD